MARIQAEIARVKKLLMTPGSNPPTLVAQSATLVVQSAPGSQVEIIPLAAQPQPVRVEFHTRGSRWGEAGRVVENVGREAGRAPENVFREAGRAAENVGREAGNFLRIPRAKSCIHFAGNPYYGATVSFINNNKSELAANGVKDRATCESNRDVIAAVAAKYDLRVGAATREFGRCVCLETYS
jgi:hypothetical protein